MFGVHGGEMDNRHGDKMGKLFVAALSGVAVIAVGIGVLFLVSHESATVSVER